MCVSTLYVYGFVLMKSFPILTATIGLDGTLFLFSGICLSGAIFVIIVMPETKGRSFDEIMKLLGGWIFCIYVRFLLKIFYTENIFILFIRKLTN